jgi:polyribonucleotide nucleotidyltransferase
MRQRRTHQHDRSRRARSLGRDARKRSRKASEEIEKIQAWQKEIVAERGKEKMPYEFAGRLRRWKSLFDEEVVNERKLAPTKGKLDKEDIGVQERMDESSARKIARYAARAFDALLRSTRSMNTCTNSRSKKGSASTVAHSTRSAALCASGGSHRSFTAAAFSIAARRTSWRALTLGGPGDAQLIDTIEYQDAKKTFMLHYNFPPFSSARPAASAA